MPDWVEPVARRLLEDGVPTMLQIASIAVTASAVIGIFLGTLLTLRWRPLAAVIRLYIEVWRGLPIIVTILVIYAALPDLGGDMFRFPAWQAAAIGLSLWGSAQVAEATRGAVQSIPKEQHEAASALGFGWVGRHVYVVVPQAFRRLLPPLVSLLVNVIQNTTLAAIIGVSEILESGSRQVERLTLQEGDPHAFQIYAGVLVLFFIVSFPLTRLAAYLERRLV